MTNVNYDYIENYIRSLIVDKDEKLKKLREYAKDNHVPIVEEETESLIKFLISTKKPKSVLELGTAIGYSAISFTKSSPFIEKYISV